MAEVTRIQQEAHEPLGSFPAAEINESIEYLKSCNDYTTDEASQHISRLHRATKSSSDHRGITAKHVGDSGIGSIFSEMFKALLLGYIDANEREAQGGKSFRNMICIFVNATNYNAECGKALAQSGGIPLLFEGLEKVKAMENEYRGDPTAKKRILMILHNTIRLCPGNLAYYRNCNAADILKGYLGGPDQLEHFFSLLILAYIATDSEKKELASTDRGVRLLIKIMKVSAMSSDHTTMVGTMKFSTFETLDAINQLAINDEVKNTIANEDGIPAIVKMLQDDFSPEEQKVAAETIWNLAFVESIRQSDILQDSIPTLRKLTWSEDKEVCRACVLALFEIQGNIADPSTPSRNTPPPSYQKAVSEPAPTSTNRKVQIMISYQWDSQERAKKIRDNLIAAGYKIWMDVTNMRGDILNAMAEAIETSGVILLCMTEQYKNSQSCRSEASYAFKLKKKIIPLLLQKDYKPDGWLGLLQGMDLYYSFYSDDRVNQNMGKLLKVLGDGPIRPTGPESHGAILNAKPEKQIKPAAVGWSKEDVQRWLRDNDLTELCEEFRRFGGRHLKIKYDQYCKDDEKFEELMKSEYHVNDAVYTDFIVHLQDAFSE